MPEGDLAGMEQPAEDYIVPDIDSVDTPFDRTDAGDQQLVFEDPTVVYIEVAVG